MKKIIFPATNRAHLSRQVLLLERLREFFEVDIFEPKTKNEGGMAVFAIFSTIEFHNFIARKKYDGVLIRGDRYEMLGLAMVSAYHNIPIAHIEGGDLSGVIDNKMRYAITQLSDYHFCTNEEAHQRLITAGMPIDKVWNCGSLDVEFAQNVEPKHLREKPYILVAYHPIKEENDLEVTNALKEFSDYDIVFTMSNKDYRKQYGDEQYSPEDYINLMRYASCCVGNSSSFLKEASILGVPVVNVGSRQEKRLKPQNVLDVSCESKRIKLAIEFQLKNKYEPDFTYYRFETSKKIAEILKKIL